jgi:hypothetical protein
MNPRPPEPLIIGRDPVATFHLVIALHNRKVRERQAARRKEKLSQFCKNALDALRFWK